MCEPHQMIKLGESRSGKLEQAQEGNLVEMCC